MQTPPEFRNEPYTDFSVPANREKIETALQKVRAELGNEYDLLISGERIKTEEKLISRNPSRPGEIVGVLQKATPEMAERAIESAYSYFPEWAETPPDQRVRLLLKAAAFYASASWSSTPGWCSKQAKPGPKRKRKSAEAIDFCEYYAREMVRLAGPQPVVQLPGEHDEMRYLPLGVGIVIPPWNFPLAILAGMTMAALVTGNTVVIKPSSETPTVAAKFAEVLLEAGFPPKSFCFLTGSGAAIGDVLVAASQDAVHFVHRLARRGAAHQRTRRQTSAGTDLDQARGRRNGRQGRHRGGCRLRSR